MSLRVQSKPCSTCIYRTDTFFDIERLEAEVADTHGGFKGHRICHHSEDAVCAGFWAQHKDKFALGQIAQRLGMVEKVNDDTLADRKKTKP